MPSAELNESVVSHFTFHIYQSGKAPQITTSMHTLMCTMHLWLYLDFFLTLVRIFWSGEPNRTRVRISVFTFYHRAQAEYCNRSRGLLNVSKRDKCGQRISRTSHFPIPSRFSPYFVWLLCLWKLGFFYTEAWEKRIFSPHVCSQHFPDGVMAINPSMVC